MKFPARAGNVHICRLTRRCHALVGGEKRRARPAGGQRCNMKDRFHRVVQRVVRNVSQIELDAQVGAPPSGPSHVPSSSLQVGHTFLTRSEIKIESDR